MDQLSEYRRRHAERTGQSLSDDMPGAFPSLSSDTRQTEQNTSTPDRQIEEDHLLAMRLAEEDEETYRRFRQQAEEDERYARELEREERARHEGALDETAVSTTQDHSLPSYRFGYEFSPRSVPSAVSASNDTDQHPSLSSSRRGSGGEQPPMTPLRRDPSSAASRSSQLDFDAQLAQQLALEESGYDPFHPSESDEEFSSRPSSSLSPFLHPSSRSASDRDERVAAALHDPMSAVLAHLFTSVPTRQTAMRRPEGGVRTFTFGYDSNRGFFAGRGGEDGSNTGSTSRLISPGMDPMLAALHLMSSVEPSSSSENNPYAAYRSHFRPLFVTQFGADLGGALFDAMPATYEDMLALAERLGPAKERGAKDDEISNLPVIKWGEKTADMEEKEGKACAICMSDFEKGDEVMMIPACAHPFHKSCGAQWLKVNRTCPICRKDIRDVKDSSGKAGPSTNKSS
ncbi:uncharacterized protein SPPG_00094 [Spizellomyces punctatus DAOM BR117]|uniref:RING-type domain-containing protein n=1 Tax=Spizellomyces punctatus (strain DAOM BR117) TaxID=645134 RepID=A0A0L0HTY3_SPIPD|nr:uncharacterized protein SPPG_00094 [Spizellomyces punctatus DAOM BR117]KND04365.1 hypothetical protein SPPG_00094 [Spizellomyces punctatus DAOM BR117]|eukprot:XP_016612404.1 hypothetical protein SPPG_00094 [Spizellomyces punctatus DAOM BR117]